MKYFKAVPRRNIKSVFFNEDYIFSFVKGNDANYLQSVDIFTDRISSELFPIFSEYYDFIPLNNFKYKFDAMCLLSEK